MPILVSQQDQVRGGRRIALATMWQSHTVDNNRSIGACRCGWCLAWLARIAASERGGGNRSLQAEQCFDRHCNSSEVPPRRNAAAGSGAAAPTRAAGAEAVQIGSLRTHLTARRCLATSVIVSQMSERLASAASL